MTQHDLERQAEQIASMVEGSYLIWSKDHDAWWGPRECGYYTNILVAGVFTETRAKLIEHQSRGMDKAVALAEAIATYGKWHGNPSGTVLEALGLLPEPRGTAVLEEAGK
jgi:hypothetical protein